MGREERMIEWKVLCDKCGAKPGDACWAEDGTPYVNFVHEERRQAYEKISMVAAGLDRWTDARVKSKLEFKPAGKVTRVYLGDKNLGWINRAEQTFYSPRNRRDHYFRKFGGWGVSKELVHILLRQQVNTVKILLQEENLCLTVRTSTFLKKGAEYEHRDFERQLVLPETEFKREPL